MAYWVLALAVLSGTLGSNHESRPIEVHIYPAAATEPASIRFTAFVDRHADNVALTLTAECSEYRRSSFTQLEGAASARKHTIVFRSLPACTYEFRATLRRRGGDEIVDALTGTVLARRHRGRITPTMRPTDAPAARYEWNTSGRHRVQRPATWIDDGGTPARAS